MRFHTGAHDNSFSHHPIAFAKIHRHMGNVMAQSAGGSANLNFGGCLHVSRLLFKGDDFGQTGVAASY